MRIILNHIPAYCDASIFIVLQNEHFYSIIKSNDGMEINI